MMNTISCICRSFNRGYNRVVRFNTHFVVGSAVTAVLLPTTSSEISYTLAEFSNESKNENQEGHDFSNVFNAKMKAVSKRNYRQIWNDKNFGESEADKDHTLLELEGECLEVYGPKVEEAANTI
uniref:Uncharacterized protein n=1 Tax=Quercus lobata TaxID=97700 RepID=A0A7N2MY80_QUELO